MVQIKKKDTSRNLILAKANIAILRADNSRQYQLNSQTGALARLSDDWLEGALFFTDAIFVWSPSFVYFTVRLRMFVMYF